MLICLTLYVRYLTKDAVKFTPRATIVAHITLQF